MFCEKPIDLSLQRVEKCWETVRDCGVPIQIGFNRRYDASHRAVRDRVAAGEIGALHQVIITSRDPEPPPMSYVRVSGGLFRDMMIHDFDLARFVLGEEPVTVTAAGSVMITPELADIGDVDTAMVLMTTASGIQCHINCSRQAVYGYDQRLEAHGSNGMVCFRQPPPGPGAPVLGRQRRRPRTVAAFSSLTATALPTKPNSPISSTPSPTGARLP